MMSFIMHLNLYLINLKNQVQNIELCMLTCRGEKTLEKTASIVINNSDKMNKDDESNLTYNEFHNAFKSLFNEF